MLLIKRLTTDNRRAQTVPLKRVKIEATIRSFAADVSITQVYHNDEDTPIEVVYCFPIEEHAAVYSFIARVNDREIVAQLKEKQKAQHEYVSALQQGHGAVMLEQDEKSQDQFIVNIGALLPSEVCTITICYVTELDLIHGSSIQFIVPTTIAPRYNPEKGSISSPANTNARYTQSSLYTIEFRCLIEKIGNADQQQIIHVNSTSHPIDIDFSQLDAYIVTFAKTDTHLDRDILINIELASKRNSTILAIEEGAVMVAFTPTTDDCHRQVSNNVQTNEFIFVIDCSGSMRNQNKMRLAKQAMLLFLKSLPVECHFNIIRFGSRYESLFQDITAVYNDHNARQAEELIDQMEADLGGTELLEPLKWLEQHSPGQDRTRQIFLLTDGEIANVSQVLDLCRSMAISTRIFSFGLGYSPSRSLVKGLARSTNGHFVFIPPNTSVDVPVGEQLQKALQPCISNIQIKWNLGVDVQTAPKRIPPVYMNDRLIVYGLIENTMIPFNHDSTVELEIEPDHHRLTMAKVDRVPSISDNQTIARLAAKALILELQHEKLPSRNGSMQARFQNMSASAEDISITTKKRIVELSLKYNILSPYTSFVGVEKRINGNNYNMVLREVPIEISADDQHLQMIQISPCANMSSSPSFSLFSASMPRSMALSKRRPTLSDSSVIRLHSSSTFRTHQKSGGCCYGSPSITHQIPTYTSANPKKIETEETWPQNDQEIVRRLINKQQYNGLWNLTIKDIEQLTRKPFVTFQSLNDHINNQTLISAIIIVMLETRFKTFESLWHGVVQKARKHLTDLLFDDAKNLDELLEDIRKHFCLNTN